MRKVIVMDTSVLVHDPYSYKTFKESSILIPITVIEELDKLKKAPNEAGKNARVAIRNLDEISNRGEIHRGVHIEDDIIVKVDVSNYGSVGSDPLYGDSRILACALKAKETYELSEVIFLSRDINLRIRARALELKTEDYEKDGALTHDIYEGFRTIKNQDAGLALYADGFVPADDGEFSSLNPNECVLIVGDDGKGIAPGRRVKNEIRLIEDRSPWDLQLRNKEQLFAADLLLDPNVPLVSLIGGSGVGKTLTSVSCAMEAVINKRIYDTFMIYRPIQPMGSEIGFLPGTLAEKLDPWFAPIDDAFAFLLSDHSRKKEVWKAQLHQYMTNGTISKNALTYIRGRSIPNAFILIDEAQQLTKEEMKAILTRAGNGTKIVVNGDIAQIDNPKLDATNNGLTYVIEKFKHSELAGHITFTKGERSPLATLASEIL